MARPRYRSIAIDHFVSPYQEPRPVDWRAVFRNDYPLDLEIGSGLGEFLLRAAASEPGRNIVGLELDWPRIKKTLQRISREQAQQPGAAENVRLVQVDAQVALERLFRPVSIHRVYCLFPCPWPKKGHAKYRLFSSEFLRLLNSRLVPSGVVQLVTDFFPYVEWLREQLPGTGFSVEEKVVPPQFDTKFERKWCAGGQREFFEVRLVKREHQDIALKEDADLKVHFTRDFYPEHFQFQDVTGPISIVLKDFMYDPQRKKAMAHLVVAEPGITQHVWATIVHGPRGWCIARAEGHTALPTEGVAMALRLLYASVVASVPENLLEKGCDDEAG